MLAYCWCHHCDHQNRRKKTMYPLTCKFGEQVQCWQIPIKMRCRPPERPSLHWKCRGTEENWKELQKYNLTGHETGEKLISLVSVIHIRSGKERFSMTKRKHWMNSVQKEGEGGEDHLPGLVLYPAHQPVMPFPCLLLTCLTYCHAAPLASPVLTTTHHAVILFLTAAAANFTESCFSFHLPWHCQWHKPFKTKHSILSIKS